MSLGGFEELLNNFTMPNVYSVKGANSNHGGFMKLNFGSVFYKLHANYLYKSQNNDKVKGSFEVQNFSYFYFPLNWFIVLLSPAVPNERMRSVAVFSRSCNCSFSSEFQGLNTKSIWRPR